MAYVVTENCTDCKYTDCIAVCPVDCFYEISNQLIISPEECIECGACEAECPVEAIYSEDELPETQIPMLEFAENNWLSGINITDHKEPLPTAESKRRMLGFG